MAITDLKFADADFTDEDIASLPDKPTISAAELKAKFDNVGKTMLALGSFNDLIDALVASTGAGDVGATSPESAASTVQQELDDKLDKEDITTTLGVSTAKVPSEKAVSDAIIASGGGDMMRSIYDPSHTGIIPVASGGTGAATAAAARASLGVLEVLTDTGEPTTATEGALTQFYLDTAEAKLYQCTEVGETAYTWTPVGSVSSLTGETAPATSTVGEVGQVYIDTVASNVYICIAAGASYTWLPIHSTSTVVPVANGGTGAATAADARTNLGVAATSHSHNAATDFTNAVPVANGGTGGTTAAAARTNLGVAASDATWLKSELTFSAS